VAVVVEQAAVAVAVAGDVGVVAEDAGKLRQQSKHELYE
jgi:hypothetical protein